MREHMLRDYCPFECNIYGKTVNTVGALYKIPTPWYGSYVLFGAFGAAIRVAFSQDELITLDPAQESAVAGDGTLTPNPETGDRIAKDTVSRFYVPRRVLALWTTPGEAIRQTYHYFYVIGEDDGAGWFAYALSENHLGAPCRSPE